MFKKLLKSKLAQTTAEYALLISLVVAAVIAMQTYAQRAIQGRIRDAAQYMVKGTNELGNTVQYEAYYTSTSYNIDRTNTDVSIHNNATVSVGQNEERIRRSGGYSNITTDGITNGI